MSYMAPSPEGLNTEKAPESIVETLVTPYALIKELTDDLENFVRAFYSGYPEDDRRFVRDMLPVNQARAFLVQPQTGWQPIDTAPKGGRQMILLLTPSGWPQIAWINTWWMSGFSVECKPTHWMPLPAAPSNEVEAC